MSTFQDLGLNDDLLQAITDLGFSKPSEVQEKAIPILLESETDLVALAQTGTGKTAAFALPILHLLSDKQDAPKKGKKIRALIVSPTRELAIQIEENFKIYIN